jgi:hypothetical protein
VKVKPCKDIGDGNDLNLECGFWILPANEAKLISFIDFCMTGDRDTQILSRIEARSLGFPPRGG